MKRELRDRWLKNLRSKRYRQGSHQLRVIKEDGKESFCCLGVLASTARIRWTRLDGQMDGRYGIQDPDMGAANTQMLPDHVLDKLGLSRAIADQLANMNDNRNQNFDQIADWIESTIWVED